MTLNDLRKIRSIEKLPDQSDEVPKSSLQEFTIEGWWMPAGFMKKPEFIELEIIIHPDPFKYTKAKKVRYW